MLNIRKFFVYFFLLILFSAQSFAQNSSSSPYSRYGIGDLQFTGFTKNIGMGGISIAYNPQFNLNISNPASYSSVALTTFETAVIIDQEQLKSSTAKQEHNNTSFSYFAFGFPVKQKKWGMAFGLLPYSNVGYSMSETRTSDDGYPELHTYDGSGGINQFFIGNSYSPFKNFSIGVNASYLFGVIDQQRRIEYPYLSNYFNTNVDLQTSVGSMYFNFGMQYTFDSLRTGPSDSLKMFDKQMKNIHDSLQVMIDTLGKASPEQRAVLEAAMVKLNAEYAKADSLKKHVAHRKDKSDWSLTFGVTGAPQTGLNASNSNLTETYVYNAFQQIIVKDTVENVEKARGKLQMPFNAGFGFMLKKGNHLLIGSDFTMQHWKDYTIFGVSDSLTNSWRVSAGAQLVPNERAIKSYWRTVQYRLGFHYEKTYLQLRNNQLNEYGASIGLGLPVRRSAAMLQIGAEVGRRGTTDNNLLEENYVKISIGFTLNDRWFIKQKID